MDLYRVTLFYHLGSLGFMPEGQCLILRKWEDFYVVETYPIGRAKSQEFFFFFLWGSVYFLFYFLTYFSVSKSCIRVATPSSITSVMFFGSSLLFNVIVFVEVTFKSVVVCSCDLITICWTSYLIWFVAIALFFVLVIFMYEPTGQPFNFWIEALNKANWSWSVHKVAYRGLALLAKHPISQHK